MQIPNKIAYNHSLSPNARLLYGMILDNLSGDGLCYIKTKKFSDMLGISGRAVRMLLHELKDYDLLDVKNEGPFRSICPGAWQ